MCWGERNSVRLTDDAWKDVSPPVVSIATGSDFACAVSGDGKLFCWYGMAFYTAKLLVFLFCPILLIMELICEAEIVTFNFVVFSGR
jgi:hypothetical protein